MTENLQINAVEDKVTIKGVAYVRANTNLGWLACFDKDSCPILKQLVGKTAIVELKESKANAGTPEEKIFKNIAKVLGEAQGNMAYGEEDIVPVVKVGAPVETKGYAKRNDTFHTAYAKDIFCCMQESKIGSDDLVQDMKVSIKLVQLAKDAFE